MDLSNLSDTELSDALADATYWTEQARITAPAPGGDTQWRTAARDNLAAAETEVTRRGWHGFAKFELVEEGGEILGTGRTRGEALGNAHGVSGFDAYAFTSGAPSGAGDHALRARCRQDRPLRIRHGPPERLRERRHG